MDKKDAILKINQIGKVGTILALITKILLGISLGACLIGLVVTLVLPKELFSVKMSGMADVVVDLSRFGENLLEEENTGGKQLRQSVENSTDITYAGNHFSVSDLEAEGSRMQIKANGSLAAFDMRSCSWAIAGAIVNLILLFISTWFISLLAKAFRDCQSPFEEKVIQRMKWFAYSLIPWAVISNIVAFFERKLWVSGAGGFDYSIDFSVVIIVLVILALAYIFQYGAVLQKESDETL